MNVYNKYPLVRFVEMKRMKVVYFVCLTVDVLYHLPDAERMFAGSRE